MKACRQCGEIKALECFSIDRSVKDGRQAKCKACRHLYNLEHRERFKERDQKRYLTVERRSKLLTSQAKNRAKTRNLEFNINWEYVYVILTLGKCQKSGIIFKFDNNLTGFRNPYAPSLDRKDNTKGYTFDNVQVVCNMYNIGKGQHTDEEYIEFCKRVAENNK